MTPAPARAANDDSPIPAASRLWWAVPAVGVVLLATLAALLGGGPEKVDYGTSHDASDRGFRAVYLAMRELGYPVHRSRRPSGGEVRWLLFPGEMSARESAGLEDWVRRGGRALLAVDGPELLSRFGTPVTVEGPRPVPAGPEERWPRAPAPFQRGEALPAVAPDVTAVVAGETEVHGPPGTRTWGSIDGGPLVTVYPYGRGEVWLLHRPDVFANVNLRQSDNAVLACRLAEAMLDGRPDGRLAFDEYCHGLRDRPGVLELLFTPPVLGVTLQLALLTGLVLWRSGVRFGPMRVAPAAGRRSKEEFLDAMAELLARKGDRADAYRTVRDSVVRQLETGLGLPVGTPVEATVREAARRRGVAADPLLKLLTAESPPGGRGPAAFLIALRQLEAAAHESLRPRRVSR